MNEIQTYLVNEIYPCLQGEGPHLGTPSVLVRFQICNLRCSWCDTPYTHTMKSDPLDPETPLGGQKFRRISLADVLAEIRLHKNIRHVIFTGGEPTLQNLAPLAESLRSSHSIEVESNGTQIPHLLHRAFTEEHYGLMDWNISPKGNNAGQSLESKALQHWSALSSRNSAVHFKFVIRKELAETDLTEVKFIIASNNIAADRVLLMAEGTGVESQVSNAWLESICLEHGWRMTPRLHVLNHGPRRGV